jgi:FHS family L-fucose permease-like MFS transporter
MIAVYAAVNVITMCLVVANLGWVSLIALFVTYFCMSIMFPTIFALGIKGLGAQTKQASSYLVMAIVGGAICPVFMGYIADVSNMGVGFFVPMVCFAIIFLFGWKGYKVRQPQQVAA